MGAERVHVEERIGLNGGRPLVTSPLENPRPSLEWCARQGPMVAPPPISYDRPLAAKLERDKCEVDLDPDQLAHSDVARHRGCRAGHAEISPIDRRPGGQGGVSCPV